jgi:predicted pyridoxine 5'-phosphate oxidase superfamily flavin-nucleotide-binding protein
MTVQTSVRYPADPRCGTLLGRPGDAVRKQLAQLDKHCRRFIELSPFLCIGTADKNGKRRRVAARRSGGFVQVLDDKTLIIPDRPATTAWIL